MNNTDQIHDRPEGGDSFDAYLSQMGPFRPLTKEEEITAGTIIQSHRGTTPAEAWRMKLITGNLRLVISMARKMRRNGAPIEELVAEGNRGLMTAADRYNPARYRTRFSTYATPWIKLHIQKALADSRLIHLPSRRAAHLSRIIQARSYRGVDAKEDPHQLAKETNLALKDVESCLSMPRYAASLEHTAANDEGEGNGFRLELADGREDPAAVLARREELEMPIRAMATCLTAQERELLACRFGLNGRPQTFQELGKLHGFSHERIRQIISKALKKLRQHLERTS